MKSNAVRRVWTDAERLERRQRREARREKQREQNIVRARQMGAARLEFKSHPLHETRRTIADDRRIWVGCSGWYYWHWREIFYPKELPGSRWFEHYASQFNTVELNAPFYSWPTCATVKTWRRQAGRRRFVYTIKVNELITHRKRMAGTKKLVADFYFIADLLGPHVGCFLFQFPPSFRYSAAALKRIVSQLDRSHRNVVEFRHKSWWNLRVYEALKKAGIIFCSTSGPRLPDQLIATAEELYIRFHGTSRWYRHDYTKEELRIWVDRIKASEAKRIWAYFNNDREGYAIKNARELIRQLERCLKLS